MSQWVGRGFHTRVGSCVFSAFVLSLMLAGAASAQTFTLSGTVTGGGSPIAGATVEALTNGTTTVAGTSTTNASGQFSIALPPAVYDLRVTPPLSSGFNSEVLQDVDLTASSQQVDVILISSGGGPTTYPLSGTVRGLNGAPIQGVTVYVYTTPSYQFIGNVQTDANGTYSIPVPAGSVYVEMHGGGRPAIAPQSWSMGRNNLAVGTGVVFNVDVPNITVTGVITSAAGTPVASATVVTSGYQGDFNTSWHSSNGGAVTNSSGAYSLLLFASASTTFTVRPPASSGLPMFEQQNIAITADTTKDFSVPATASVSGVLRGHGGQAVPSTRITARNASTGATITDTFTAANGTYVLNVPPGNVVLSANRGGPSGIAPASWSWESRVIAVTGATTFDIDLPTAVVSGSVLSSANAPIGSASITANSGGSGTEGSWSASGGLVTPAAGTYSMLLFRGTANFTVRPPSGSPSGPAVFNSIAVDADLVRDFTMPDNTTVSGTVRGIGGQPIAGARVNGVLSTGVGLNTVTTDANGNYTLPVPPGTLNYLQIGRGTASTAAPQNWDVYRYNLPVAGPMTIDVNLNVIRLNGTAQDSNGAPVPNVSVTTNGYRFDSATTTEVYSSAGVSTNAAGSYSMLLLTGSGSVSIRPPTNSGFSQVTLNSVSFANNFTQRIVLQRPDTTAPVIVNGPAVLHLSDTSVSIGWTTNEPSTSIVDYGIGELTEQTGSTALTTQHTVTLLNLLPNEIYSFRVSSRDRNNNGPAQSGTGFFTMLAPPGDVTPPSITGGPLPTFLGDTAAIVQWLTNEPASSVIRYGTTPSFGNQIASGAGEFLALHSVVLPGLTPSTEYFAQVESADPDGNTTVSSTFTFTTAAAPDIQAPVITAGPEVVARTHNSATIRWTTDEAATSGVSYNDGSVFNVTSDDSLTTTHEVILAGLSPSKTYSVTVASRDAGGNGPRLAGPFTFTTLATPDVTPPSISSVSVTPTKNTAAVSWMTVNDPTTTVVRFGTTSGSLDRIVSDLSLQASHAVTLTGLFPGTTYFYSLRSTDAAGNTTNTPEASFTTLPEDVNVPPTPPSPVTVSPNPGNTGSFTITWGASTDDGPGGVKDYAVLLGDTVVETLPPTQTSYLASGVAEGSHVYRIRAKDFSDAPSLSEPVTVVVDRTAPSLNVPEPITTPATTNTDAIVTFTVAATDSRDPNPSVSCSPASGSAFPIGTTTVPCTARDSAGNVTNASFNVTVTDPFAPVLTVPASISLQAENPNGAVVTFSATATDNHDPNPTVSCSPASGSVFPVGTTPTICTATDASGNTATRSFNVSVGAPPKVASSTVVSIEPAAPTFDQAVTFTATVTGTNGSTPTGVVQFFDGTDLLGTGDLGAPAAPGSAITASLTIASMRGAGTRSLSAVYVGDAGHDGSTSATLAVDVAKATPGIQVLAGGKFIFDGLPRAATGAALSAAGTPIGTLTFTYNGSPDPPVNAGSYAVVGSFAGDDNYTPASGNATLTIHAGPTHIGITAPATVVAGELALLTASVTSASGQVPQGSVEFFDGVTSLGTSALNAAGVAQFTAPSLGVGSHALSATYSGGGNFAGSKSPAVALEVSRASTATSLAVAPNPAGLLEAFKLTATVAVVAPGAGVLSGVVEFFAGPTTLGSAPLALVGGVPTAVVGMNGFPAGTYPITARYVGTASFAESTSNVVNQVVRGAESSTWTALTVSPTPSSRANTNVTLRAAVVPLGGTVQPTGTVQFYAWSTPIGAPVALANVAGTMTATLVTPGLPSGLLQLRAVYLGASGFATSVSAPVAHTVYATTAPFATALTMTLSGNPIAFGSPLTATVSVASGTRPTPGYFLLFVDGVPTQAVAVVSGSPATFTIPSLGRGLHGITVQFVPSTTSLAGSLSHQLLFVQ